MDEAANNGRRLASAICGCAWSIPAVTTRLKGGGMARIAACEPHRRSSVTECFWSVKLAHYPLFPVDVAASFQPNLRKRSTDPARDDIETRVSLRRRFRIDAFTVVHESGA